MMFRLRTFCSKAKIVTTQLFVTPSYGDNCEHNHRTEQNSFDPEHVTWRTQGPNWCKQSIGLILYFLRLFKICEKMTFSQSTPIIPKRPAHIYLDHQDNYYLHCQPNISPAASCNFAVCFPHGRSRAPSFCMAPSTLIIISSMISLIYHIPAASSSLPPSSLGLRPGASSSGSPSGRLPSIW